MRIFLASPTDVANYREAAKRVIDQLNEENGSKLGSKEFLEVVDWNSHLAPLMSLPERAILQELTVGEHDLFLGVAWLGFDVAAADSGIASTERNFEIAFEFWREQKPEQCLLYRCMRLPEKLSEIDGRRFHRIGEYFSRFELGGTNPVRYYEFDSATDLEEHLRHELHGALQRLDSTARPSAPSAPAVAEITPSAPAVAETTPSAPAAPAAAETTSRETAELAEFERRMEPGKAYEVSFLAIEIVETEQIALVAKQSPRGIEVLNGAFRELVRSTAANYGGEIFRWSGGGGLVIFWSSRSYDHAIMTGLKVLHNLPVFNLDPEQNPAAVAVRTRTAAHDAVILYQHPSSEIVSQDIDFVLELKRDNTGPGELSITRRLLERIDERLKPHFKPKDRFQGEPVYVCRLPSAERGPRRSLLEETVKKIAPHTALILEVLEVPSSALDVSALEALSTAVDQSYSLLAKFCTSFASIDVDWPRERFEELLTTARKLRGEEAEVWSRLRRCYVEGSFSAGKARKLEAIVQAASRRRSRTVVILDKLVQRCEELTGDGGAAAAVPEALTLDEELVRRVDALIRADALDIETVLTELLLNRKKTFLAYLAAGGGDERHRRLLDKLWEAADLVLLDDLYSIRGRQRADEPKVFDTLVAEPAGDGRFRAVHKLLDSSDKADAETVVRRFTDLGIEPSEADQQMAWRCLVLGHSEADVRNLSAFRLTPSSMWQAVSHPSIPIASIYAIGERVGKVEGEDTKKIFFDCIRARVEAAVLSFRTHEEMSAITKLVLLLLDFPFLVETGYFERFDDVLGKFLDRSQKAGLKVEYFESLRKTLEEARAGADKTPSKPPAGIKRLPPTIQRRLAGEARYVYWFVSHPDPRIASETLRHVGLMNIERVLRLREVNSAVLTALLRKPELFTRSQAIVAALNHPKCPQQFAGRYVPMLGRSRMGVQALEKVVANPSANPVVRSTAKNFLGVRGKVRVQR